MEASHRQRGAFVVVEGRIAIRQSHSRHTSPSPSLFSHYFSTFEIKIHLKVMAFLSCRGRECVVLRRPRRAGDSPHCLMPAGETLSASRLYTAPSTHSRECSQQSRLRVRTVESCARRPRRPVGGLTGGLYEACGAL